MLHANILNQNEDQINSDELLKIIAIMASDNIDKFIKVLSSISSLSARYKCASYFMMNVSLKNFNAYKFLKIIELLPKDSIIKFILDQILPHSSDYLIKFAKIGLNYDSNNLIKVRETVTLSILQTLREVFENKHKKIIGSAKYDKLFMKYNDLEFEIFLSIIEFIPENLVYLFFLKTLEDRMYYTGNYRLRYFTETEKVTLILSKIVENKTIKEHMCDEIYEDLLVKLMRSIDFILEEKLNDYLESLYKFFDKIPNSRLNDFFVKLKHENLSPCKLVANGEVLFWDSSELNLTQVFEAKYIEYRKRRDFKNAASVLLHLRYRNNLFYNCVPKQLIYRIVEEAVGYPKNKIVK